MIERRARGDFQGPADRRSARPGGNRRGASGNSAERSSVRLGRVELDPPRALYANKENAWIDGHFPNDRSIRLVAYRRVH